MPSDADLKRKYGLTRPQHEKMRESQDNTCPLCLKKFTAGRPAAVDHEHRFGQVRGLLCLPCNGDIAIRHEDAGWYERAAEYIRHPPAQLAIGLVYVPDSPGAAGHTEEK